MRRTLYLIPFLAASACTAEKTAATDTTQSTAAVSAAPDDGASRSAIEGIRSAWKAAADKKDAAAVASYYADDAAMVTTEAPPANGKAEITNTLSQMLAASSITSIDSKDLVVEGNNAYAYGSFQQEVKQPDGKTRTVTGYYMVSLRKQPDGSWKIYRHVGTTPPAPR